MASVRLRVAPNHRDDTEAQPASIIPKQGRLIVSQSGFALITSKRLQWFTVTGTKVGELVARDPIRAIHAAENGAIVQTRQHQVEVSGLVM